MTALSVAGTTIESGQSRRVDIPVARLPTGTELSLPVEVVCGEGAGTTMWLSAAVHGDELNGVEIIRRVLENVSAKRLRGAIVAVPIVNVYGFLAQSRYLPDRRDLNRCFPGSAKGSLASRLAHLFLNEIVARCGHGIDLHTAATNRSNLPQIRADLSDEETLRCAAAFAAPVMIDAHTRDGSLRWAATKKLGAKVLLYEAGEPLRFNEDAIATGVAGVLRVMAALDMIDDGGEEPAASLRFDKTTWVRARRSGIMRLAAELGQRVKKNQKLGLIEDAFGSEAVSLTSPGPGVIIGHTINPLVHQGDAVVHVGLVGE